MSEQPELLPCPFCGGKATLYHFTDDGLCGSCDECGASSAGYETEACAIAEWNRRAPDATALVERLCEALTPFGTEAETWLPHEASDDRAEARLTHPIHGLARHSEFTFGDLFRARAALAEAQAWRDSREGK